MIKKLLVVVGQAKSGTTSIFNWLGKNPNFALASKKETRFFSSLGDVTWSGPGRASFESTIIKRLPEFENNFSSGSKNQWCIDGSTDYLWRPESIKLLKSFSENCDVKILCLVRDPVERAVSEYIHTVRLGFETKSFIDSIKLEDCRRAENWHPLFYHIRRSEISSDIQAYREVFQENFKTIAFSELKDTSQVIRDVCDFLGVPFVDVDTREVANRSMLPRSRAAAWGLQSTTLRSVGRRLMPVRARSWLWHRMHARPSKLPLVSEAELNVYRSLISKEAMRCLKDPGIPTDDWGNYTSDGSNAWEFDALGTKNAGHSRLRSSIVASVRNRTGFME